MARHNVLANLSLLPVAAFLALVSMTPTKAQILELNPAAEELPSPVTESVQKDLRGLLDLGGSRGESLSDSQLSDEPPRTPKRPALESTVTRNPNDEAATALSDAADTVTIPVTQLQGEPVQRGPIHEAFAEPLQLTPAPTEVLKKSPPATVEELAPESPGEAKNMEWISGYWAWEEQRQDYIWVSGIWRKIPKGRTWIPGRWENVDNGHQWVPGAWLEAAAPGELVQQQILPAPPETLEQGPTSPAPSDNHFWIPGVWQRNAQQRYAWRPGYWSRSQENWVWVPDHYVWSPTGCRYVSGYWDYTWERRGTLYAPCTFGNVVSEHACYTPSRVIDTSQWLASLWVQPRYGHYYYGDYFDVVDRGYSPWYRYYGSNRTSYDPFYSYYRLRFPSTYGIGLYGYLDGLHSYYRRHPTYRPSVSFHTYQTWPRSRGYSSLYGNVSQLYGYLGMGAYQDRHRHYGSGPNRSRNNGRSYGTYDRQLDRYESLYRDRYRGYGSGSNRNSRTDKSRRIVGYANGQPLYEGQRGKGGISRAEIGTSATNRSVNRPTNRPTNRPAPVNRPTSRPGSGSNRNRPSSTRDNLASGRPDRDRGPDRSINRPADRSNRSNSSVINRSGSTRSFDRSILGQSSGSPHRQLGTSIQPSTRVQPRQQPRSRPATRPQTKSRPQPRKVVVTPPTRSTSRPTASRPTASRPTSRPQTRPQSRPTASRPTASRPTSRPQTRPQSRPAPSRTTRPQPRPTPKPQVTRSTPKRTSSPGFSTHNMKKARGADLARQRAAMQKRMNERKKKK